MDKYYKKITIFLSNNNSINKEDKTLYEYALKILFQDFVDITITILIGIVFRMFKECLCLFFTFFLMRKSTGGLHLKKYCYCLISSVAVMALSLFLIKLLETSYNSVLFLIVVSIFTIVIWVLAPIENQNKKLSKKAKCFFKYLSIALSLLFWTMTNCFMYKNFLIAYSFGMGLIITSILLIIAYIKRALFATGMKLNHN